VESTLKDDVEGRRGVSNGERDPRFNLGEFSTFKWEWGRIPKGKHECDVRDVRFERAWGWSVESTL
jgi:hypothetical protein